jgi:hypothetical protein
MFVLTSRISFSIIIFCYQKLPSHVVEIKEHCNEHHEKFNLYCKEHECPCCGINASANQPLVSGGIKIVFYIATFTGRLLVPDVIIRPVVNV